MPAAMLEYSEGLLEEIPAWMHDDDFTRRWFDTFGKEILRLRLMQEAIANAYTPARAGTVPDGWTDVWSIPVPDFLAIWERMLRLNENPVGLTLQQRRDRVLAFVRKLKGQASGLSWEEAVTALLGVGWTYTEHIEGDGTTPAAYTVRINLSAGSGTNEAAEAAKLLRDITPAHLALEINHGEGFQVGIDLLGTGTL